MVIPLPSPTSPPAVVPSTFPVAKEFEILPPKRYATSPPTMFPLTLTVEYEFETEELVATPPTKPPA